MFIKCTNLRRKKRSGYNYMIQITSTMFHCTLLHIFAIPSREESVRELKLNFHIRRKRLFLLRCNQTDEPNKPKHNAHCALHTCESHTANNIPIFFFLQPFFFYITLKSIVIIMTPIKHLNFDSMTFHWISRVYSEKWNGACWWFTICHWYSYVYLVEAIQIGNNLKMQQQQQIFTKFA